MKKKMLALLLAVVMCFGLLTACGSSDDSSSSSDTAEETEAAASESTGSGEATTVAEDGYLIDTLKMSCSSDGGTFDPYAGGGWGKVCVCDLLFQYLGDVDNDGNVHWTIAKSVEPNEDYSVYTIEIWDCVYDSYGNQITADDILYSLNSYLGSGRGSNMNLDSLNVVDEYTLEWVCKSYPAPGEIDENMTSFSIVDEDTYENVCGGSMANNPIGTGPYVLDNYSIGTQFTFLANEDFWMNSLPEDVQADEWVYSYQNVREIHYDIIQDNASIAMALENGDIDCADQLGESDIKTFKDMPDTYNMIEMPTAAPVAIIFNCSDDSPCGDINLRQAICYGLDTEYFASMSEIFPAVKANAICTRTFDVPESWNTGEGRSYYDYDFDKAQELVAQSTYDGESLKISYSSSTFNDYLATMIQATLQDLGITIEQNQWDKTVADVEKYETDAWDMRMEVMGGGNYTYGVLKTMCSDNVSAYLPAGMNEFFVYDSELDDLYYAVYDNCTDETINAWGDYFDEQCYAYSLCNYSNMTACKLGIDMPCGKKYESLMPNAAYPTN